MSKRGKSRKAPSKVPGNGNEYQIRLGGSGGQGLQLSATLLAHALALEGKHVAQSQSYEPTSRGGLSRSDIVVSDRTPDYPLVTDLDLLLLLDQLALEASLPILKSGAVVLSDSRRVSDVPQGDFSCWAFPFTETALNLGNARIANVIALGSISQLSGICKPESLEDAISSIAPKRFLELNLEALSAGRSLADV